MKGLRQVGTSGFVLRLAACGEVLLGEKQAHSPVHKLPRGLGPGNRLGRAPFHAGEELLTLLASHVKVSAHEFLHHDPRLVVLQAPWRLRHAEVGIDAKPFRPFLRNRRQRAAYRGYSSGVGAVLGNNVKVKVIGEAQGSVRKGERAALPAPVAAAEHNALETGNAQGVDLRANAAQGLIDHGVQFWRLSCHVPAHQSRPLMELPARNRQICPSHPNDAGLIK